MSPVASVIVNVLWLYLLILIGRLVFDIVQMLARDWQPKGPVLVIAEIIYTLTDPPLRALRGAVVGDGGGADPAEARPRSRPRPLTPARSAPGASASPRRSRSGSALVLDSLVPA